MTLSIDFILNFDNFYYYKQKEFLLLFNKVIETPNQKIRKIILF